MRATRLALIWAIASLTGLLRPLAAGAQDTTAHVLSDPDTAQRPVPCTGQRVRDIVILAYAPTIAALRDVPVLMYTAVSDPAKRDEATRLGAVEALARMAREGAEAKLVAIGKGEKDNEELRKAAWRGLRRSKRARTKQARASSF